MRRAATEYIGERTWESTEKGKLRWVLICKAKDLLADAEISMLLSYFGIDVNLCRG